MDNVSELRAPNKTICHENSDATCPNILLPFWASVHLPLSEMALVVVVFPGCFFIGAVADVGIGTGLIAFAIMAPITLAAWAVHRILLAWTDRPSEYRVTKYLKSFVRRWLLDR